MRTRGPSRIQALAFLLVWVTLLFTAELLHGAIHHESETINPSKECPICRFHSTSGSVPDPTVLLKPVVQLVWLEPLPRYEAPLVRDGQLTGTARFSRAPPMPGGVQG